MGLPIPVVEQRHVVRRHRTKNYSRIKGGDHNEFLEIGMFGVDERSPRNLLKVGDLQQGSVGMVRPENVLTRFEGALEERFRLHCGLGRRGTGRRDC
jgi:hypothetical protein